MAMIPHIPTHPLNPRPQACSVTLLPGLPCTCSPPSINAPPGSRGAVLWVFAEDTAAVAMAGRQ